jgi:hydroxyacylglutathione hydrolase
MLIIHTLALGPMENNTLVVADEKTGDAIVVDPSFELEPILDLVEENEYRLRLILLTHAHFDHSVNALPLSDRFSPPVPVSLHPSDLSLWTNGGSADLFGVHSKPSRNPDSYLFDGQHILLGEEEIEVRHTPGHTPGSVVFVIPVNHTVITGDLIFFHSIGRTDLPGGDSNDLFHSIRAKIFTLPRGYRLIPGHGPETSVAEEVENNPFLE